MHRANVAINLTTKMAQNFTRLFELSIILQYFISVSSISITQAPTDKFVFLNGNVEFNCKIRNDESYKLVWLIKYNHGFEGYADAETTASIDHEEDGHGSYSLAYSTETDSLSGAVIHNLILKIDGVQLIDEGNYSCGYERTVISPWVLERLPLGTSATLSVLVPPNDIAPKCSFSPSSISLGTTIALTCEMSGGQPLPGLTWYKDGVSSSISSTTSTKNSILYTISSDDNGVSFTCVANGPALTQEGTCSVIPFQVDPVVSVSYLPMPIVENSDVIFTCTSSGLPSISKLDWLYNGQIFADEIVPFGYQIIDTSETTSELHLFGIQLFYSKNEVKCRVMTPTGLSNDQTVIISVIPASVPAPVVTTQRTDSTTIKPGLTIGSMNKPAAATGLQTSTIMPIAAAAGGLILILVIAIIATIIYKRHKNAKQRSREDSSVVLDRPRDNTYEMGAFSADGTGATRSTRNDSIGYVISQISPMNSPARLRSGIQAISSTNDDSNGYVINQVSPTSSPNGTHSDTLLSPHYHVVNPSSGNDSPLTQRSVTMESDNEYDPVNFAEQSATRGPANGAHPTNGTTQMSPYASNIVGNAERIRYADLDLSNVSQSNEIHGNPPSSPVKYSVIEGEL